MSNYRISQLAERAGLRPTTLRFYEQAGLLPAQRSEAGYRIYDDAAVERLDFISAGKRVGLPLEEIRELLGVWEEGLCSDVRRELRPMLQQRISDAQRRAAELDAFTDRLHQALAMIDGPPRPGRCDAECTFLHPEPGVTPVTIQMNRPADEPAPPPIACTLTGSDQAERIGQWQQLLEHATNKQTVDGGIRISLPTSLAGHVAELAAAEQQCCGFFTFTLHLADGELHLDARAPDDAAPLLADIFGAVA